MNRWISALVSAGLVACLLGCGSGHKKAADAASGPAPTQGKVVGPAQTRPVVMKRFPARQFSSKLSLDVFVLVDQSDEVRFLGRTPTDNPVRIPECDLWGVVQQQSDLADVVKEVKAQSIPALRPACTTRDDQLTLLEGLDGLRELYMYCPGLTDAGLDHLKGLTGLRVLDLPETHVTDAGLDHLKGLTSLERLSLAGCTQVTDAGLQHLKGLRGLRELDVYGTHVTDAGVAAIEKAIPGIVVKRYGR